MSSITTKDLTADRDLLPWEAYVPGHHWRNAEDEAEGAKLGMWLFLSTEVLLFMGFFTAYAAFRMKFPGNWYEAAHYYLDWQIGAINTCVLLLSSWTVVMAVRAAQLAKRRQILVYLAITNLCALFFLATKLILEYWPKIQKGKLPGANFAYTGEVQGAHDHIFLSVYWISTATHGFHVLVGVFLISWCMIKAAKNHYGPKHYTSLENVALYWHLVDVIWIFLFPLLYLA
ncbi:MAG: cytochrome c oxidase subunit 3 [Phycisphaerales bacterium]|nr:cytochrome c oxidase subunit 3 [Phycisphaerales bacterium]